MPCWGQLLLLAPQIVLARLNGPSVRDRLAVPGRGLVAAGGGGDVVVFLSIGGGSSTYSSRVMLYLFWPHGFGFLLAPTFVGMCAR